MIIMDFCIVQLFIEQMADFTNDNEQAVVEEHGEWTID